MMFGWAMFKPLYLIGWLMRSCEISTLVDVLSLLCFVHIDDFVSFHSFLIMSSSGVEFWRMWVYLLFSNALVCIALPRGDVCLHVMDFALFFIFSRTGSRLCMSLISPFWLIVRPRYFIC